METGNQERQVCFFRWRWIITDRYNQIWYYFGGENLFWLFSVHLWFLLNAFVFLFPRVHPGPYLWEDHVSFVLERCFLSFVSHTLPTKLIMTGVCPLKFRPMFPSPKGRKQKIIFQQNHWFPQGIHVLSIYLHLLNTSIIHADVHELGWWINNILQAELTSRMISINIPSSHGSVMRFSLGPNFSFEAMICHAWAKVGTVELKVDPFFCMAGKRNDKWWWMMMFYLSWYVFTSHRRLLFGGGGSILVN